jgi:hypothetical protein
MNQNMTVAYMAAQVEHQLIAKRAEEHWRRMDPAGRGKLPSVGLFARVRALFARSEQPVQERTPAPLATATGRERCATGACA